MLGKLLDHSPSLIYRWVKEAGVALQEPSIAHDIKEIEFDEMWYFVGSKKQEMDHQSRGSLFEANHRLGYRWS